MSTVTARYTDAQGNPVTGTVYISPAARAGIGEPPDIVVEKRVWADLDVNGAMSIEVIPSDDPGWLIDGNMPYLVEERLNGLPFRAYWIGVPDAGVDLSQVQQVEPEVAYVPVPGPKGDQGDTGPKGDPGADGADGADGEQGPPGGAAVSGWWSYRSQPTAPPAVGEVRAEGTTDLGATVTVHLNHVDADGLTWTGIGANIGDHLILRDQSGHSWTAEVTAISPQGGYTTFTTTILSTSGTLSRNNQRVQVSLVRAATRRVTHPNGDDVLVEVWDDGKGRWQRVHYDSGWRNVSSMLVNGWAATHLRLRRQGATVSLMYYALNGASATSDEFITGGLPLGFRPDWMRRFVVDLSSADTSFGLIQMNPGPGSVANNQRKITAGRAELRWTTDDPIPTSLPGTLVTAAPN